MARHFIIIVIIAFLVTGCAELPKRALYRPEKALDTGGTTTMLFHSVLYYPGAISLNFPGYIIGIEKSPVDIVADSEDILVAGRLEDGLSQADAYKQIVDKKILYVSHIVKDINAPYGIGNCALYNAYVQPGDNETEQFLPPCKGIHYAGPVSPHEAYKKSWQAMEVLRKSLEKRLSRGRYTHVVVLTMGWNTVQEEAVRNFKTIIKYIKEAADEKGEGFNPLFIGVTWPSQWQSSWFSPLAKTLSFSVKANDSDELGLTWLGVLLHYTLPRAMAGKGLPIVVIGHSFGARASSVATCVGPVIYPERGLEDKGGISRKRLPDSTLINLEGAFSISRLLGSKHDQGIFFHDQCANITRVFLTSSRFDLAMDAMFFGPYAGSFNSYNRYCRNGGSSNLTCVHATRDGEIEENGPLGHIVYINADKLIYQNAYLSGGGAHSDIYRPEHGRFLWNLISGRCR